MSVVTVLLAASLVLLVGALFLSLVRLIFGPTPLDRAVAVDVFAAGVVAIIAVLVVRDGRYDLAALLIVFVLTAFFSTVTVARLVGAGRWRDPRRKVVATSDGVEAPSGEDETAPEEGLAP